MTFSDLQQIQFWPYVVRTPGATQALRVLFFKQAGSFINMFGYGNNGTPITFNELQSQPGMRAVPYFAPMDFADDIVIQFLATTGSTYKLNMIRADGHGFIFNQTIPEVASGVYQVTIAGAGQVRNLWGLYQFSIASTANLISSNILPAISTWTNVNDNGENWTIGATASIVLDFATNDRSVLPLKSNLLRAAFPDTSATTETLVCNISGTATGGYGMRGYVEFRFYSNGVELTELKRQYLVEFNRNSNVGSSTSCTFSCKLIMPAAFYGSIDAVTSQAFVTDFSTEDSNPTNNVTFVISTGQLTTYSDNMIIYAKSDHHDCYWAEYDEMQDNVSVVDPVILGWPVGRSERQTVLIRYTNTDIYENVNFNTSPGPFFNLRIPGAFFHETFEKQQEVHKLSSGRFVTIWDELTRKVKLEISHVPYYIHMKIQLALSCDSVNVGGTEKKQFSNYELIESNMGVDVVVQDQYSINEGDRRYPLKTATVLLTDKDFIRRNLL